MYEVEELSNDVAFNMLSSLDKDPFANSSTTSAKIFDPFGNSPSIGSKNF